MSYTKRVADTHWKTTAFIAGIAVINSIPYLVRERDPILFFGSFILSVVWAVIIFLLSYHLLKKTLTAGQSVRAGLVAAAGGMLVNTVTGYFLGALFLPAPLF